MCWKSLWDKHLPYGASWVSPAFLCGYPQPFEHLIPRALLEMVQAMCAQNAQRRRGQRFQLLEMRDVRIYSLVALAHSETAVKQWLVRGA